MAWSHIEGINIEAATAEQTRYTSQNAEFVFYQNRDGVSHIYHLPVQGEMERFLDFNLRVNRKNQSNELLIGLEN